MENSRPLFEAIVNRDYEALVSLYGSNASSAVVSYLSMESRWSRSLDETPPEEAKLDDFLQEIADRQRMNYSSSNNSSFGRGSGSKTDEQCYYTLLRELAVFLTESTEECVEQPLKKTKVEISLDGERLLRDSAAAYSDSRPPADFVVYHDGATQTSSDDAHEDSSRPPIFDGSVANATPPPLGGAGTGASGGAGSILHLACALDVPLALAFLLAMGADARASHTAFRRLMIHEAACNGSIQCLTLLLELGRKYGDSDAANDAKYPLNRSSTGLDFDLPFLPRRIDRSEAMAPLQMYIRQAGLFGRKPIPEKVEPGKDFVSVLRLFRDYAAKVRKGIISELDAARIVLEHATLTELAQNSIVRSCGHYAEPSVHRSIMRPAGGSLDGHGNTPLHWAAFKNETECVALLLKYKADPNARAHPSGWTPLHDAAYSDSKETIQLLLDAGANVDARANSGATPLCFAAQENSAKAAALLLERGADLTARCAGGPVRDDGNVHHTGPHSRFSGYTPLHYCAHYNAAKAARVLLKHPTARKAMEIPDLSDRLPIHVAVARGSADVLRELLHAGARVETRTKDNDGETFRRRFHSVRSQSASSNASAPTTPIRGRQPPSPERVTPRSRSSSRGSATPVSSPVLRAMIPQQPVTSSKPWNCLTQRSIDECRQLIAEAEKGWEPDRHTLFTPSDRTAVLELLRVGKRLEQKGTGLFVDMWPQVLSFCGRGWFDGEEPSESASLEDEIFCDLVHDLDDDDSLALPRF